MKMKLSVFFMLTVILMAASCEKEELNYSQGDLKLKIEAGKGWNHDFPLFLGLSKKNPPQFAVWIEDTNGQYITTLYASSKIATEGWIMNGGNRRKEALPYWCHQRGKQYADGLYLPTKDKPLTDGITGATPKSDKEMLVKLNTIFYPIIIKAEFNHSVDFNDFYTKDAPEGSQYYSGGKMGSGQPALVYSGILNSSTNKVILKLIGHSSPDGSSGNLYPDLSEITTAREIVKQVVVETVIQ